MILTDATGRTVTLPSVNGAIVKLDYSGRILWIRRIISTSYYIGSGAVSSMGFWVGFTININSVFRVFDETGENVVFEIPTNNIGRQLLLLNI